MESGIGGKKKWEEEEWEGERRDRKVRKGEVGG